MGTRKRTLTFDQIQRELDDLQLSESDDDGDLEMPTYEADPNTIDEDLPDLDAGQEYQAEPESEDSGGDENEEQAAEQNPNQNRRRSRPRLQHRLVKDLEAFMDENNYNPYIGPETKKVVEVITEKAVPRKNIAESKVIWCNQPWARSRAGRPPAIQNRGYPANQVAPEAAIADDPLACFSLFMTDAILEQVLHHTNKKIENWRRAKTPQELESLSKKHQIEMTDMLELKVSAVKAGLENAIEGSRLSVFKLHAEVDVVEGQFCCSGCHILAEVERGHGSIGEHTLCSHCKSKHNMALTSNMLKFLDQKMLEPPEVLFAGQTPHNRERVGLPQDSGLSVLKSIPFHSNIRGSWQIKFVGAKMRGGAPVPPIKKGVVEKEDMFEDSDEDMNATATESKEFERKSRAPRREMDHRNPSKGSSRSQSSGEEDVVCLCGKQFGRKSSLVRHYNTKCDMNAELKKDITSGPRNERIKRSSTKSPLLTPRSSGAKRPLVRNDGDGIPFVTFEEDGRTEQLLKSKLQTLFTLSAH